MPKSIILLLALITTFDLSNASATDYLKSVRASPLDEARASIDLDSAGFSYYVSEKACDNIEAADSIKKCKALDSATAAKIREFNNFISSKTYFSPAYSTLWKEYETANQEIAATDKRLESEGCWFDKPVDEACHLKLQSRNDLVTKNQKRVSELEAMKADGTSYIPRFSQLNAEVKAYDIEKERCEALIAQTDKQCRDLQKISSTGFNFYNHGKNKIARDTIGSAEEVFRRQYTFNFPGNAMQNARIEIVDNLNERISFSHMSYLYVFPRSQKPTVRPVAEGIEVTWTTGETLIIEPRSGTIVSGFLAEGPVAPVSKPAMPDVKYVGNKATYVLRADKRAPGLPSEGAGNATITKIGTPGKSCTVPKNSVFKNDNLVFIDDESFYAFVKTKCKF